MGHGFGKAREKDISMRLKALIAFSVVPLCLSVPIPEAEAEARAQDPSMLMLNSMTLLPLLLAGAAFAKGYLFGNIKNLKSSQYGGYGHRLGHPYGYAQYGYGRRISAGEYTPPGIYGGEYTTSQSTTEFTPSDPYQEYSDTNTHHSSFQYSPYQYNNYGY